MGDGCALDALAVAVGSRWGTAEVEGRVNFAAIPHAIDEVTEDLRELNKVLPYTSRVEAICPACGAKHDGPWTLCSSCKAAWDRGL